MGLCKVITLTFPDFIYLFPLMYLFSMFICTRFMVFLITLIKHQVHPFLYCCCILFYSFWVLSLPRLRSRVFSWSCHPLPLPVFSVLLFLFVCSPPLIAFIWVFAFYKSNLVKKLYVSGWRILSYFPWFFLTYFF